MNSFNQHRQRFLLNNELHARPFAELVAPEQVSHFAALCEAPAALAHLAALCAREGVNPPQADASHFAADFGAFRLKWEKHTEFSTYTAIRRGPVDGPFDAPAADLLPREWVAAIPGEVLVALHLCLLDRDAPELDAELLARSFVADSLVSSLLSGGAARVWTDFRIHQDGFGRILVHDVRMGARQAGRVVQRLIEVETYRAVALLGLPVARGAAPDISRIDQSLAELTQGIRTSRAPDDERGLLDRLSDLSAEIEAIAAATSYRFGASRAYNALVAARVAELREQRVEGFQTIGEFLERRMAPAMRTCESVAERQDQLSERATRAANLLRTRVDIALEGQNRDLLHSMNRRARLQLRLQETVEGLSVAAISYYVVSLVNYLAKSAVAAGATLSPDMVTGAAIVPVVAVVWWGMRRVRSTIARDDDA